MTLLGPLFDSQDGFTLLGHRADTALVVQAEMP